MAVTSQIEIAERLGQQERAVPAPVRWFRSTCWFVQHKPLGAVSAFIILIMFIAALFANYIAPFGYDTRDYSQLLASPSWTHWLGTYDVGRDIYSRIVYGARVSIIVGFGTIFLAQAIATVVGVVSAYFGGVYDLIGQRLVDVWQSFPGLVLLIVFAAVFGTPTTPQTFGAGPVKLILDPAEIRTAQIILALGLVLWAGASRITRSAVIAIRHNQYIENAQAIGAGHVRILWYYVLPNVLPVIIVSATIQLGLTILIAASLSFLGFGIPPPVPDWGSMLSGNATQFVNRAPILAVWPGLAISLAVFGFNMLGDALRDVLDPRMRGSQ